MTLVYLHAVGLDGRLWAGAMRLDALAPDLPGCGAAAGPSGELTLDSVVAHLAAGLAAHPGGPADLVGLSLGSMLAQQLAVRHPDLVRSLVLACGGMRADPAVSRGRATDTRERGMAGTLDATLGRWFSAAALATPGHPGVTYARERLLADDADVVASYWAAMADHDLSGRLGAVTVPTTCVGATDDASVPVAAMRAVADTIPGARMVEIAGPHIVVLENPGGFAAVVDEHLARVGARSGTR